MQPLGSIFQNIFLGGAEFKISLKKWGFIQENPQTHDFSHYMGLYSRVGWGCNQADTVYQLYVLLSSILLEITSLMSRKRTIF